MTVFAQLFVLESCSIRIILNSFTIRARMLKRLFSILRREWLMAIYKISDLFLVRCLHFGCDLLPNQDLFCHMCVSKTPSASIVPRCTLNRSTHSRSSAASSPKSKPPPLQKLQRETQKEMRNRERRNEISDDEDPQGSTGNFGAKFLQKFGPSVSFVANFSRWASRFGLIFKLMGHSFGVFINAPEGNHGNFKLLKNW
ncbi:uncharacterized protein LOC111487317 [Cucurbita maxima]|uniref:Uncharacterized protein LOC111487317 n=1 Tax=Cucurbita maxima TaxID=3661 RepID=A0A6J1JN10_CUCMA|nr:uncharacterized protein LOC111487317 [Cucurbita maxima]